MGRRRRCYSSLQDLPKWHAAAWRAQSLHRWAAAAARPTCVFAGFGYHNFDWNAYIEQQNRDTLVIPMDEDFEFTDNIDEILRCPALMP